MALFTKVIAQSKYNEVKSYYQSIYDKYEKEVCVRFARDSIFDNRVNKALGVKVFLEQDSVLNLYTDSLTTEIQTKGDTIQLKSFTLMQQSWENLMIAQSSFIYEKYKLTSSGHTRSSFILNAYIEMIRVRIKTLQSLLVFYRGKYTY